MVNKITPPRNTDYVAPDVLVVGISAGNIICLSGDASSEAYEEENYTWSF